jgi:thiamine biosynthesis lipoprotein
VRLAVAAICTLLLSGCATKTETAEEPTSLVRADTVRSPGSDAASLFVRRAWPVMGTLLEVEVRAADSASAEQAVAAARAAVFRVDTLMSVYKPESEVSVVNRRAGSDSLTVLDPQTAEVLEAALRFAELSGGALDVTVGPLVDTWGFYRESGSTPQEAALDSVHRLVGYGKVRWNATDRTVRLPLRGMRLDFGAIAKGYAVDRAVAALRESGVAGGRVDLGGNLRWFGASPSGGGGSVALRDPRNPEDAFALVHIDSGSVATSGDYERFFEVDGRRYSHILDPRTGFPTHGTAAVSVLAPTGMEADALSTAFFVLGPEAGCRLARRLPGVEAVWVRDPGTEPLAAGDLTITPGLAGRVELAFTDGSGASTDGAPKTCGA